MNPPDHSSAHQPVLYHEILQSLLPKRGGKYADLTLGAGGHAWGILDASRPDGQLLGLDVDPQALALAKERLAEFGNRAKVVRASYTTLTDQLTLLGWQGLDGILLDLGASSMQFDTAERGFSFLKEAPLDMRFDPDSLLTAADIVNTWDADSLADILYRYGEERRSRQIAAAIIKNRPVENTMQLAEIVSQAAVKERGSHIHPATKTFQALRIAVNGELDNLEAVLPQAVAALKPGGRLAVIAFHSLEDRLVKNYFRNHSRDQHDPDQPWSPVIQKAIIRLVNRKPVVPGEKEIQNNPRARSAKLRVVEKM
jgi:16S rRNA (cytosine1402-N4)-methyltransferase